jgi:hypothetical protein
MSSQVSSTPDSSLLNTSATVAKSSVKIATPEYILIKEDQIPPEVLTDLIFENIGGREIINIARNDLINGQPVIYQPIKNVNTLSQKYPSQKILHLKNTLDSTFKNFTLKLEKYIPEVGTGPNGEIVYIDPETGNLVVNTVNTINENFVEIQILSSGDLLDDTIYDEEL